MSLGQKCLKDNSLNPIEHIRKVEERKKSKSQGRVFLALQR